MDHPAIRKKMVEAAQGQDTHDLLEHIAWQDLLKPELLKIQQQYQMMLVNSVLGVPQGIRTVDGRVVDITKEQLAGRVEGITVVIRMIEEVLRRGDKAIAELRDIGLNP